MNFFIQCDSFFFFFFWNSETTIRIVVWRSQCQMLLSKLRKIVSSRSVSWVLNLFQGYVKEETSESGWQEAKDRQLLRSSLSGIWRSALSCEMFINRHCNPICSGCCGFIKFNRAWSSGKQEITPPAVLARALHARASPTWIKRILGNENYFHDLNGSGIQLQFGDSNSETSIHQTENRCT